MNQLIILLALCGQTQDQLRQQHEEITARWAQQMSPTYNPETKLYSFPEPTPTQGNEQYHQPTQGWSVPEPDEERTTQQKINDGRAQFLREKWLTQTLVTEKTTDPYRIQSIKDQLSLLSSKEVLDIQKELDRRSRIRATQYFSRKAEYNRRVRDYYRPRPYFYYWWGPRGYTFRYGTYSRGRW